MNPPIVYEETIPSSQSTNNITAMVSSIIKPFLCGLCHPALAFVCSVTPALSQRTFQLLEVCHVKARRKRVHCCNSYCFLREAPAPACILQGLGTYFQAPTAANSLLNQPKNKTIQEQPDQN